MRTLSEVPAEVRTLEALTGRARNRLRCIDAGHIPNGPPIKDRRTRRDVPYASTQLSRLQHEREEIVAACEEAADLLAQVVRS